MKLSVTAVSQVLFAAIALLVSGIARGGPGLLGAALGIVMVWLFFGSTKFILGPIVAMSPAMSQALALLFFFTKAGVLAAVLIVLQRSDDMSEVLDFGCLAVTLIVGSVLWISSQTIDHTRARIHTYDLPKSNE